MEKDSRASSRLVSVTRRKFLINSALALAGAGTLRIADAVPGKDHNPTSWDSQVKAAPAQGASPEPKVVEVYLVAAETYLSLRKKGPPTRVWAFNGQVPGPQIEANVGDTLIVHLSNQLPVETSIHWHGVELPADMDGSNLSQLGVQPGETFTYEFKILNAATHWYHPHFRTNEQVDLGMAGPVIFRDPEEDARLETLGISRENELTLVLDDMLLDESNQPREFATEELGLDPGSRTLTASAISEEIMNGREGNVILVNGRETPTVKLRRGVPQRWRIVNVANGRFMRLSVAGHTLYRIGGDGGLLNEGIAAAPIENSPNSNPENGILLSPAERADVVFVPSGFQGEELFLEWHDIARGRHSVFTDEFGNVTGLGDDELDGERPPIEIMRIKLVGADPQGAPWSPPSVLPRSTHSPLIDIRSSVDLTQPEAALPVFFGHTPPAPDGNVRFFVAVQNRDGLLGAIRKKNAEVASAGGAVVGGMVGPPPFMPRPFPAVDDSAALTANIGETRFWEVINFTGAVHPFHAHGFFFQPIETLIVNLGDAAKGIPSSIETLTYPLESKDTIRLPGRPGALGRSWTITRLAVQFDDNVRAASPLGLVRTDEQMTAVGKVPAPGAPGGWVFHCHISEHGDQGMMSYFNLMP